MKRTFFLIFVGFTLISVNGCESSRHAHRQASAHCADDDLSDLVDLKSVSLDRNDFYFVAHDLQDQALDLIGKSGVARLNTEQAVEFGAHPPERGGSPYLIRACFFMIYPYSSFDPEYYPDKNVLVAYSAGLASRHAKPHAVALVHWSQYVIKEVRILAFAAE